jgi:hypothetical protein
MPNPTIRRYQNQEIEGNYTLVPHIGEHFLHHEMLRGKACSKN